VNPGAAARNTYTLDATRSPFQLRVSQVAWPTLMLSISLSKTVCTYSPAELNTTSFSRPAVPSRHEIVTDSPTATRFWFTLKNGGGGVGVSVGVRVAVGVNVSEKVAEGVWVLVCVGDRVGVNVFVTVWVHVWVRVGVEVPLCV